ncbi:hypothetical protein ASPFODRAFT_201442 [Aspergillus luchuensis CBS 106.47]|uniref:Uncharacterized protein n=1 Tax=Aspergillus luchuensis (strain CBS 106.47) TaxID=1137211 RepID=A0A1M3TY10_ASPLC|nr:hypothetical protein ASPFODRAFT_201442 [Aspergillus luchuensis CBS 106.47]
MLDLKDPVVYEHHSNRHSADPTLGNMQFSLAQQFFRHDLRLYFYICFSALKWLQEQNYDRDCPRTQRYSRQRRIQAKGSGSRDNKRRAETVNGEDIVY